MKEKPDTQTGEQDMKLYMPTEIYNEKNCVENHSRELAGLGKRALVVTGKHSSRINGSLEDVLKALEREKVPCVAFIGADFDEKVLRVVDGGEGHTERSGKLNPDFFHLNICNFHIYLHFVAL